MADDIRDMEEAGRAAYRATYLSAHYAHLRGAPVEEVEKLYLPSDNPDTPVQVAMPISKAREAFRRGWALEVER